MTDVDELAHEESAYVAWLGTVHVSFPHGRGDLLESLNHLDAAAKSRAAASITDGTTVSLSRPVKAGPTSHDDGSAAFRREEFGTDFGWPGFLMRTDRLTLDCHGHVNTHIDALNHLGWNDEWYNGEQLDNPGAAGDLLGIARHGLFTRAVHADIAKVRGGGYVDAAAPVSGIEIDRALAAAAVDFCPGDALLLDCGRDVFETEVGGNWGNQPIQPGSGPGVHSVDP